MTATATNRPRDLQAIADRYPRLVRSMQWCAILSPWEAAACIRDHRDGFDFSGEAVNHYGGPAKVLSHAWQWRNAARQSRGIKVPGSAD